MSNDPYISAIEAELRFWPGVRHEFNRAKKHRRVHLTFGKESRWSILPSTSSDNVRGPKNNVADLKRTLLSMGATRVGRILSKKEEIEMAHANDIKFGIAPGSIVTTIPEGNPLFEKFMGADGKTQGHWKLELRSNPDLKSDPFVAIVRAKLPAGALRKKGTTAPGFDKKARAVTLSMRPHIFPAIAKLGEFRSAPVEVQSVSEKEVVLKLPPKSERQAPILRGDARLEKLTAPEPEPVVEAPVVETPAPECPSVPVVGADMLAKMLESMKTPERMMLQLPERPLTVERCINFLNQRKAAKGNNLRFEVDGTTGLISYIEKGGPKY